MKNQLGGGDSPHNWSLVFLPNGFPPSYRIVNTLQEISFDILFQTAASGFPSVANLDQFIPDPAVLETCRRWLNAQGVQAFSTGVSLACKADLALFQSLFSVRITTVAVASGETRHQLDGIPQPPAPIAPHVKEIALTMTPLFFTEI